MKPQNNVVAGGHPRTVEAAELVLRSGGNAFDALVAGLWTACVCEPVLASLGGGGFALVRPQEDAARVYDFFVQSPLRCRPAGELDFYAINADFGTATQEFHIGNGTSATPGMVSGLFAIHRQLGRMPMRELVNSAVGAAKNGVIVTDFQAYVIDVVKPIYLANERVRAIFSSEEFEDQVLSPGAKLVQPELADFLDALPEEGPELFYRGEVGASIIELMNSGGQLTFDDLASYEVEVRKPLQIDYRGCRIMTNPAPALGGMAVAFGLDLSASVTSMPLSRSVESVAQMADIIHLTGEARLESAASSELPDGTGGASSVQLSPGLLDRARVAKYRQILAHRQAARRGTTHISIIDREGNLASATVSNGEGSGHLVPGAGIMLNNMLGEEDLNPGGFHRWKPGARLASMMAPSSIEWPSGKLVATGSGGSNRIRSAILQVIVNLIDHGMSVEEAVLEPRLHVEVNRLSIESNLDPKQHRRLLEVYPDHQFWGERNMFFGGVHTVSTGQQATEAVGDPRRGGASARC